jgi:transposase
MKTSADFSPKGREIVMAVIRVQGKLMTATEAAADLGMSRKTYYKWERRILQGMMEAAEQKASGRPATEVDPEKEGLRQENEELKKEVLLLEQKLHIRDVLKAATDESLAREKKG